MGNIKEILVRLRTDMNNIRSTTRNINNSIRGMLRNISRDTRGNMNEVNRTVKKSSTSMINSFKKVGMAILAAFSVRALINFGKESIKLASDLVEVQNVVDVTFGESSKIINEFAKTTFKAYGLSELGAKKYAGTFGAMLKSMGIAGQSLEGMSIALTALAGDFASFYNLPTDVAFSKIRAGISGEVMPLKQLGINLSVASLEAYALQEGITESYKNMSQANKAILRYNYLLDISKDSQGDFVRTSSSWANQIKVLGLNFERLKATLGEVFKNALLPLIQGLNRFVSWLNISAVAFGKFIANIKGETQKVSNVGVESAKSVANASKAVSDGLVDTSEKAIKEVNKAKRALSGFDELVSLSKKAGVGDADGDSLSLVPHMLDVDVEADETNKKTSKFSEMLSGVIDKVKEIGSAFKDGFVKEIDGVNFDKINSGLLGIDDYLVEIGSGTYESFKNMGMQVVKSFGSITGSIVKVGAGFGEAIVGGFKLYLSDNKGDIINSFNSIFDSVGDIANNIASVYSTLSDILYEWFTSEDLQAGVANVIQIVNTLFIKSSEGMIAYFADVYGEFSLMLENLSPKIKEWLGNSTALFRGFSGLIATFVSDLFKIVEEKYNKYVKPTLDNIREGTEKIVGTVLDNWNNNIAPVLKNLIDELKRVYDVALKPLMDKFGEFVGKLIEFVGIFYNKVIAPIIGFIVDTLIPVIGDKLAILVDLFGTLLEGVAEVAGGIFEVLGGILEFLSGVFTGDWTKVWEGLKSVVEGIWDVLKGILKVPINVLISGVNMLTSWINKLNLKVPDWVPKIGGREIGFNIKEIPKLADGGVVSGATQFIAGEAGSEAIVPLQNSDFIKTFAEMISDMISENSSGGYVFNIGTLIQDDRGYDWLAEVMSRAMVKQGYLS